MKKRYFDKGVYMNRLKDKVAIVTGSTSGIGKGIAKMFAAEGARVVVCGRREERGAAIVNEIQSAGGEAMYHFLDVTKPETVDALLADTEAAWGKIDVMVNNAAGMALKDGRVDEISLEDWDAVFASDIRSTFYCTKIALPYLKRNDKASIINIGSMAACSGDLGSTAYACAKAGVDMLTKYTALQYGKDGIMIILALRRWKSQRCMSGICKFARNQGLPWKACGIGTMDTIQLPENVYIIRVPSLWL